MRKNCDIVEDLIPMYIEFLTSESSNEFIKEHLTSCEDCTNYLRNMGTNFPNDDPLNIDEEIDDKKLIKNIKHKIYRMKFFSILIGVLIGLIISLKFFPLALVGVLSFALLLVLLVYLLNNDKKMKS